MQQILAITCQDNYRLLSMQKIFLIVVVAIIAFHISPGCSKSSTTDFCTKSRSTADTVVTRGATVHYYNNYGRWGLKIDSAINTIDATFEGFPCTLDQSLSQEGLRVKFSGVLKKFNDNEVRPPRLGGQQFYFIELSAISK